MRFFINFFGRRRFNYIDLFAIFLFIGLWEAGQYIAGIAAFFALFLVSVTVENRVK